MSYHIGAFLMFPNGSCEEAFNFYHKALGGELIIKRFSEINIPSFIEGRDLILTATLRVNGAEIIGGDVHKAGKEVVNGNGCTLYFTAATKDEVKKITAALAADGGGVHDEEESTPSSGYYTIVVDKYGYTWQIYERLAA